METSIERDCKMEQDIQGKRENERDIPAGLNVNFNAMCLIRNAFTCVYIGSLTALLKQ